MEKTASVVSVEWLHDHLSDPNLVIVDCRYALGNPDQGRLSYEASHIPGAIYLDLGHDLSGEKTQHGGRHPLPSVDEMAALFSRCGIDQSVTVVVYDELDITHAARLWWMLRYLGHENVAVLDGGFSAWQKAAYPVTAEITPPAPKEFVPNVQAHMLVTIDDVLSRHSDTVLIDSRAGERFRGEVETIDSKAGHIPGAVNFFFKENLDQNGLLRSSAELQDRFMAIDKAPEVIVYCGSGVTACVNLLALEKAGRKDAKLYLGSWSDYCSRELPVATGE